jgi:glutaminase
MDEFSIDDVLAEVAVLVKPHFGKGRPADYIPELADVPGRKFGMAVRTIDGGEHVIGDADEGFSVQSITKVFALGLALNRFGDEVWTRVGKEPSGTPFNHLSQLEAEGGVPRNPFINAGALAITDHLLDTVKDPPSWCAASRASWPARRSRSTRRSPRRSWRPPTRTAPSPT